MRLCHSCSINTEFTNNNKWSWSGCIIENHNEYFVLTTLAPLANGLLCKDLKKLYKCSFNDMSAYLLSTNVSIILKQSSLEHRQFLVRPSVVWQSEKLESELTRIYCAPAIARGNESTEDAKRPCCHLHGDETLLSWFVIFSFNEKVKFDTNAWKNDFCGSKDSQLGVKPYRGMAIWTSSFPFNESGLQVFKGCISKGIICNIFEKAVILIDACCLPGAEGCPVYAGELNLIGVVLCCVELSSHQLSGLNIVCSIEEIKRSFHIHCFKVNKNLTNTQLNVFRKTTSYSTKTSKPDRFQEIATVSLHNTKGWGSGVVVAINTKPAKIYVATCRHVVEFSLNKTLEARLSYGSRSRLCMPGKVVYASNQSWLDFALVEIACTNSDASLVHAYIGKYMHSVAPDIFLLNFSSEYRKGDDVFTKGHCLFESSDLSPTVTAGVISNIVYHHSSLNKSPLPLLIHSNCIVLDGASGGGLFSTGSSVFYGVIVNNVKLYYEHEKFVVYPQINFILPCAIFMPCILLFILGKPNSFQSLDILSADSQLEKSWLLNNNKATHATSTSKL